MRASRTDARRRASECAPLVPLQTTSTSPRCRPDDGLGAGSRQAHRRRQRARPGHLAAGRRADGVVGARVRPVRRPLEVSQGERRQSQHRDCERGGQRHSTPRETPVTCWLLAQRQTSLAFVVEPTRPRRGSRRESNSNGLQFHGPHDTKEVRARSRRRSHGGSNCAKPSPSRCGRSRSVRRARAMSRKGCPLTRNRLPMSLLHLWRRAVTVAPRARGAVAAVQAARRYSCITRASLGGTYRAPATHEAPGRVNGMTAEMRQNDRAPLRFACSARECRLSSRPVLPSTDRPSPDYRADR